jgi:hypothetical protein
MGEQKYLSGGQNKNIFIPNHHFWMLEGSLNKA